MLRRLLRRTFEPRRPLRRLLRRTFEPRRPLLYEGQYALAALTAVLLVGSIALVAWVELR